MNLLRITKKQEYVLTKVIRNLSELLALHGISKGEDFALFLSILVYIQNEIEKQGGDLKLIPQITKKTFRYLSPLLFSSDDPLKSYKFVNQICSNLKLVKLPFTENDERNYYRIIAHLTSEVIAMKNRHIQENYVRRVVDQIFSETITDPERLFLLRTMSFVTNPSLKHVVYMKMKEIKNAQVKGFRRTLYNDIIKQIIPDLWPREK